MLYYECLLLLCTEQTPSCHLSLYFWTVIIYLLYSWDESVRQKSALSVSHLMPQLKGKYICMCVLYRLGYKL